MARNKYPEKTVERILDVSHGLFEEKGYDNTSIQDIVETLGDLSKGAIYHHFKSKEEILNALCDRQSKDMFTYYETIINRDDMTGLEKLREIFNTTFNHAEDNYMYVTKIDSTIDPKIFTANYVDSMKTVAPKIILPIIEQGQKDHSIQTKHPEQLADTIILFTNFWLAPMCDDNLDELKNRIEFFDEMLKGIGIDLITPVLKDKYNDYCEKYLKKE